MRVEWYGQSAFTPRRRGGDGLHRPVRRHVGAAPSRGIQFDYPPIEALEAPTCCSSPTSTSTTTGSRSIGGEPAMLRSTAGHARLADRRGRRDRLRARRGCRAPSAARTRSSSSSSTASASPTSATSARPRCATSRRRRSARSTCCSSRSAAARRSAPPQAARDRRATSRRAGSCRCTTARRGSASSRPLTRSSTRCARRAPGRAGVRDAQLPAGQGPLVVVPAAP